MEYFVNIENGEIYKIDCYGFEFKYVQATRKWENISGLIDFSISIQPMKPDNFALIWIHDYFNQTTKADKNTPDADFTTDTFKFYKNNETKDIITIDPKNNAFLCNRKKIKFLGKDYSDLSGYELISNVDAMDTLDGRERGHYYLFDLECYADQNQVVHGYSEDGHHFVFQDNNYCIMYVDDKKPSPSFQRIVFPKKVRENPNEHLKYYARMAKYYLKEAKELPKYIHKVVDKYNNEHHTNISYDLQFSVTLWNNLIAEDINHDFYDCRPNSLIKLDKKNYPTLKQLGTCHNTLVSDTIKMNAVRREDLAKGHITVFDICWTKKLLNGTYEGVAEDGRVFILNEDGTLELANRTVDVSTLTYNENLSLKEVVQQQFQGRFAGFLDGMIKLWNMKLKDQYIKIGTDYVFYGKPSKFENKYSMYLKDSNGRLFSIKEYQDITLADKSVVVKDDWIEIPKYNAATTFFQNMTDQLADAIRKEIMKNIKPKK